MLPTKNRGRLTRRIRRLGSESNRDRYSHPDSALWGARKTDLNGRRKLGEVSGDECIRSTQEEEEDPHRHPIFPLLRPGRLQPPEVGQLFIGGQRFLNLERVHQTLALKAGCGHFFPQPHTIPGQGKP